MGDKDWASKSLIERIFFFVGGNQDKIDLTGRATAESLGRSFYSGTGGQAELNQ